MKIFSLQQCVLFFLILTFITALIQSTDLKPGKDFILNSHMSAEMECKVTYQSKGSADPYGEEICNVTKQSVKCKDEYQHRAALSHDKLILENVKPSDSGVYTIQDLKYNSITLIHTLSVKAPLPTTVKRHQSTTLGCSRNCSGLVKWTFNGENVAQCNQTLCISEESYEISHDQYLKGHHNLTIVKADYSMRGIYYCMCKNMCIGEVQLVIETENSTVQLGPGEDLLMDFPITESVEVMYNGSVIYSCDTTDKKQCKAQHSDRLTPVLKLGKVKPTDSGVYIIQDHQTKYQLLQFNVSVREDHNQGSSTYQKACLPVVLILSLLTASSIGLCI